MSRFNLAMGNRIYDNLYKFKIVDASVAQFVKWAMRSVAATFIFQVKNCICSCELKFYNNNTNILMCYTLSYFIECNGYPFGDENFRLS